MHLLPVLFVLITALFPGLAQARWAAWLILTPEGASGSENYPVTLQYPKLKRLDNGDIEVRITARKAGGHLNKQWYVVTSTRPLKGKERQLEGRISSWHLWANSKQEFETLIEAQRKHLATLKDPAQRQQFDDHIKKMQVERDEKLRATLLEDVALFPGLEIIEKELPLIVPEGTATRTYLFYGFPPGAMVLDGGERVSVDLPAFINALTEEKAGKP